MSTSPMKHTASETFVVTPFLQDVISRTTELQSRGGVFVWHGEPGIGRTTAALHLLNIINGNNPPGGSSKCKAIYHQLSYMSKGVGILETKRGLKSLYEGAFHTPLNHGVYLRSSPESLTIYILEMFRANSIQLLFVDDADFISEQIIKAILFLQNMAERFGQILGVVFIGTKILTQKLEQMSSEYWRIKGWFFFQEYDLNDTWEMLARLHPHFSTLHQSNKEHRCQVEFLQETFGGYPARLVAFLGRMDYCLPAYERTIDERFLRIVHKLFEQERGMTQRPLSKHSKFSRTLRTVRPYKTVKAIRRAEELHPLILAEDDDDGSVN
jgi:DNA polymerase III delta prime subunit